jgi:hypothetical protein
MEVIRNSTHNGKDYVIVDTTLKIEKGESTIEAPIHIRVDITKLVEIDRVTVFGKVNGIFNHALTIKSKQKVIAKKPWWKIWQS